VFNKGRIERVGSPTDLYDNPGTQFVAEFLGEANILPGEITDQGDYRWGAQLLKASTAGVAAGSLLLVRPEYVRVVDSASVPAGWNSVAVDVLDVSHLGPSTRVDFRFPDGRVGTARLESDTAIELRPGQSLWATWSPDSQRFVTVDPAPGTARAPLAVAS